MADFKFELNAVVKLAKSGEVGDVIGRAEYNDRGNDYCIRYVGADGALQEKWWSEAVVEATA